MTLAPINVTEIGHQADYPSYAVRARFADNRTGVFNLIKGDRFLGTIEAHLPNHRERTYPPTETLAMFVAQVLCDDSSCQRAVNVRNVRSLQHGLRPPSTSTAAYSEARARLPNDLVGSLYQVVGQHVSDSAPSKSLWHERRALFIGGTETTIPDTPDNQRERPQPSN